MVGYGGFKGGLYSNQIQTNVGYLDSQMKIPTSVYFEYEVLSEEEMEFPIKINERNSLTLDYDVQIEEVGDVLLIISDSKNKQRYTLELLPGKHAQEIVLPQGNYDLKLMMKKGSGTGDIKWSQNEEGS